jgi:hypothetical protein
MIKLHKINLVTLAVLTLLVGSVNVTQQTVQAATDPDGRTIIEDNTPLSTSEANQRNDRELLSQFLIIAAIVVLVSTLYINRNKLFKHKKNSRKSRIF